MKVREARPTELAPSSPSAMRVSPRQLAVLEREKELRRALNLAATRPASEVVVIEPEANESLATIRASLERLLRREPRDLYWGVRGGAIVIAKDSLPPRVRHR
jgi:hypothetical protein